MTQFSILCSGQGAQSPELFTRFPFSEKGLALKRRVLEAGCLAPDLAAWLAEPARNPRAIFLNHFSQPLLCLYQAMVWEELKDDLPKPAMIAGYSLGELSAYCCSGAIAPEDAVRLAATRAKVMDAAGPLGELIAVTGLPIGLVAGFQGAHLAIVIGDDHCVIGCLAEQAVSLAEELKLAGAKNAAVLAVTVASHTPILDAAVEPFRLALQDIPWHPPGIPVLAGVSASKVLRQEQMLQTLPEQIHRTIRWDRIQQRLLESGSRVLLEIGPGDQLAHMAVGLGANARGADEFRSRQGVIAWVKSALERAG